MINMFAVTLIIVFSWSLQHLLAQLALQFESCSIFDGHLFNFNSVNLMIALSWIEQPIQLNSWCFLILVVVYEINLIFLTESTHCLNEYYECMYTNYESEQLAIECQLKQYCYNGEQQSVQQQAQMHKHELIILAAVLFLLVGDGQSNYIISVESTSYTVNTGGVMTIKIKTSTSYSLLDIAVSNVFTISNPACTLNATNTSCTRIVPSTGSYLRVRFSFNFTANQNYTLTFNTTNPVYSDSFVVQAFAATTTEFGNSGSINVLPKTMSCSMSPSSNVVSQISNVTFLLSVSTLPAGTLGKISLIVNSQTQFPNVFNTGPSCLADNASYSCTLSQVFGQQILSVVSVPVGFRSNGSSLAVVINSLRNPPYNSTFESIQITIKDMQDRDVQTCTVVQPSPTVLQESVSLVIQGWSGLVGQTSNVQFLLTPFFSPLADITIGLVYQKQISISPRTPTQFSVTSVGNYNYLRVSNATYTSSILQFNATWVNPSSTMPLSLHAYILYNSTLFRQHRALGDGQLTLIKQTMAVAGVVLNAYTLVYSSMNVSIVSPININSSMVIAIRVEYGQIQCANLSLSSSMGMSTMAVSNCTSNMILIQTNSTIVGGSTVWINMNYRTYTSVIVNNMVVDVNSTNGYAIMSGASNVLIRASQPTYTISSSNSTFTAISNYTFVQANVTAIPTTVIRSVTFVPPSYVKFNQNTTLVSSSASTVINSYYIDLSANQVTAVVGGALYGSLNFVKNPAHYLGARDWTIICKDSSGYNSSTSTAMHSPQYSPARSSIAIQLSNNTIQQVCNASLTYQPLLQYDIANAPTITTQFSKSSINSVDASKCNQCVELTSTKFKMPYYSVVMRPIIQIVNNDQPVNNYVSFAITIGDFTFQTGTIPYDLLALQYDYIVTFTGQYANLGLLEITITTALAKPVNLSYTGTSAIFSASQSCLQCNNTYLKITGIVGYFQNSTIIIQGRSNGILYARGVVTVSYPCSSIPGCQICENVNSTLQCTRCFSSQFTNTNLLYNGKCYSVCPTSTYPSGAQCQACPHLCYRCNAANCLQCVTSYYIYSQTCVLECPPFYIKNATHCLPRPVICPTNCIDCPSDNVCQKCDAGYYLLQNLCYSSCPTNYLPNDTDYTCKLFIPPAQTNYFPFAFFIGSFVALILLGIIKKFERRSLILGNLIAVASVLQIGAILLMLGYTFMSISQEPQRWLSNNKLLMQALIFIIALTKVALNVIFLVYFLRRISSDQQFQKWLQKSAQNKKLYIVLIALSGVLSFQIMRIIYSRFLGLQLFFGRFNTSLIFKPLNFFSLAYIVPGGCLILMAIFNISMQNGYRTSIFYSSIEVILIEIFIFVTCFVAFFKSDQEYFDYQVYKVENASQHNSAAKIQINQHEEDGGSYNQKLIMNDASRNTGPIGHSYSQFGADSPGKIIRNMRWRQTKQRKQKMQKNQQKSQIAIQQVNSNQNIHNQQNNGQFQLKLSSHVDKHQNRQNNHKLTDKNKDRSIFRKKILEDWQKIKSTIPQVHVGHKIIRTKAKSKSPLGLNKSQLQFEQLKNSVKPKQLTKITSLQKLQKVQKKMSIPIPNYENKNKLKQHFYSIRKGREAKEEAKNQDIAKQQAKKMQQQKQINIFDQKYSIDLSDEKTIAMENNNLNNHNLNTGIIIANRNRFPTFNLEQNKPDGDLSQIQNNQNEESFQKSLLQLKKDIKTNRYEDFDNYIIDEDQQGDEAMKNKNQPVQSSFNKNKKKLKKRNVNRQTQAVYLQRLVSSSEANRTKPLRKQKLDDF